MIKPQGLTRQIGYPALVLGILVFLAVSIHGYRGFCTDYSIVYSSSKCLVNQCDPYNYKVLFQEYVNAGGAVSKDSDLTVFQQFPALYPPSSIFWVAPFTLLPFKTSLAIWMTCSALLFTIAALLMADFCRQSRSPLPLVLLGLFVATSSNLVTTGQPSSFAISLCVIGVWSLLTNRLPVVGILSFALSLTLKPQIAGLVLVYFLLAPGRTRLRAVFVLATTALLCVPGIVWAANSPAASHWVQSIATNLAGSAAPGSINDPGPSSFNAMSVADLQSVFALFENNPRIYNLEAEAAGGFLMLIWAVIAIRATPSRKKDVLGLAAMSCLSLLPIYHRHYDVRLLILTFPALTMLVEEGGWEGIVSIAATILVLSGSHPHFLQERFAPQPWTLSPLRMLLILRTTSLACLFAALAYLASFARTLKATGKPPLDAGVLHAAEPNPVTPHLSV